MEEGRLLGFSVGESVVGGNELGLIDKISEDSSVGLEVYSGA